MILRMSSEWNYVVCEIFAGQPTENYQFITRSIRLGGHSTSVKLENKFWVIIDTIARTQDFTTPRFLGQIYDEALEINGEVKNFASLLRCACVLYLEQPEQVMEEVREQLIRKGQYPH